MPVARKLLVAATLVSGPAPRGKATSTSPASGEAMSLISPIVSAPPRLAVSVNWSVSGLRPDCEAAMNTAPDKSSSSR